VARTREQQLERVGHQGLRDDLSIKQERVAKEGALAFPQSMSSVSLGAQTRETHAGLVVAWVKGTRHSCKGVRWPVGHIRDNGDARQNNLCHGCGTGVYAVNYLSGHSTGGIYERICSRNMVIHDLDELVVSHFSRYLVMVISDIDILGS
jgi:hypothetical protein